MRSPTSVLLVTALLAVAGCSDDGGSTSATSTSARSTSRSTTAVSAPGLTYDAHRHLDAASLERLGRWWEDRPAGELVLGRVDAVEADDPLGRIAVVVRPADGSPTFGALLSRRAADGAYFAQDPGGIDPPLFVGRDRTSGVGVALFSSFGFVFAYSDAPGAAAVTVAVGATSRVVDATDGVADLTELWDCPEGDPLRVTWRAADGAVVGSLADTCPGVID